MKKLMMLLALATGIGQTIAQQSRVAIIPQPVSVKENPGSYLLPKQIVVDAPNMASLQYTQKWLQHKLTTATGYTMLFTQGKPATASIVLQQLQPANASLGKEGYELEVNQKQIIIKANEAAGFYYGVQSLVQLFPKEIEAKQVQKNVQWTAPCAHITDYPRFAWRGLMFDVSRHFFTKQEVKDYIDQMARYKFNVFHWHLTDDEGWRLEINKPGETPTYGGYYTQAQLKDIVAYARQRNVTIVPEIEMPGHVASAIAAYPELSCTQQPQLPLTGGDYSNMASNYCAGNETVFTFLQDVLTETMAIFPSTYIHIGGDEVDKGPWKKCARCQQSMQQQGLKNEEELQSYFIQRIEKFGMKYSKAAW